MDKKEDFFNKLNYYKKQNPDVGYNTLSKMFGVSLYQIFKTFNVEDYELVDSTEIKPFYAPNIRIEIKENMIYEESKNGDWKIFHLNDKGKVSMVEMPNNKILYVL